MGSARGTQPAHLYHEALGRTVGDPQLGAPFARADHEHPPPVLPGGGLLDEAIVRPGQEEARGAIRVELDPFPRPAREGDCAVFGPIDRARTGVFFEDVYPGCPEQPIAARAFRSHPRYIRPLRATSSAVRIRSTCWLVNMNIAASST